MRLTPEAQDHLCCSGSTAPALPNWPHREWQATRGTLNLDLIGLELDGESIYRSHVWTTDAHVVHLGGGVRILYTTYTK